MTVTMRTIVEGPIPDPGITIGLFSGVRSGGYSFRIVGIPNGMLGANPLKVNSSQRTRFACTEVPCEHPRDASNGLKAKKICQTRRSSL